MAASLRGMWNTVVSRVSARIDRLNRIARHRV